MKVNYIEEKAKFKEYVNSFDMSNEKISNKYFHSLRVMEIANHLALSLNFNEEEIYISNLIGLLHDIGRFEQARDYDTFVDAISIDHGDLGYEILKSGLVNEFTDDERIKKIILISTKNHNKLKIENGLTEEEIKFCKLIRDADKLDILKTQCLVNDEIRPLKKVLLDDLYNDKICKNTDCENQTDKIVKLISWIADFNYPYSYQYLKEHNIMEEKIKLLGNVEGINELRDYVNKKIEERC